MPILHIDFETRSTVSIKIVGAWRYATHAATDVWCAAFAIDDGEVKLWIPGDPVPQEIVTAANDPTRIVAAHNANFERQIIQHVMPRHGWPQIPLAQYRCTMASSSSCALPAALEKVAHELKLEHQKDTAGGRLMLQMSMPRRPRQDEDPSSTYWFDDPERLERLYRYCKQDVEVERELYHRLLPLIPGEQEIYALDQRINDRGFHTDGELITAALEISESASTAIDTELATITGNTITSIGQVARIIPWLAGRGVEVKDVQKGTLHHALRRKNLPPDARRVIELRLDGAHASKLDSFQAWRSEDGRVRGAFRYHGASTGRWSSHGVQVQNLKKPEIDDVGAAIEAVRTGDYEHLRAQYPQPLAIVGDIARALICAAPGHRLIAADFSGVESRITAWVSGQQSKLDQWAKFDRTGNPEDEPYRLLGLQLGVPEAQARTVGKTADLAFGYMGSVGAWRTMAGHYLPDDDSDEVTIQRRKAAWRAAHPMTVKFWGTLNRATIMATQKPGTIHKAGRITLKHDGTFLFMRLPGGRALAYPFASLMTSNYGELTVTFMALDERSKFGPCRHGHGAWPGLWIENLVQAIARDVFAEAMLRLEAAGYPIILHVHDEIVAEVPDGFGSEDEFRRLITTPPAWADGMPIAAKVRNGSRFIKIDTKAKPASEAPPWEAPKTEEDSPKDAPGPEEPEQSTAEEAPGPGRPEENTRRSDENREDAWRGNGYQSGEQETGHVIGEYIYRLASGEPYLKVIKRVTKAGKKSFPQYRWQDGQWIKGPPPTRILYRLPELISAPASVPVHVTEGEKDAESLAALELIATTNPEGAGKWLDAFNAHFTGRQTVYVHEDNDDPGHKHAIKVAHALQGVNVPNILIVSYPDVPEGEDVSYWLNSLGHTKADFEERLKSAKAPPPGKRYTAVRASDVIARPLDWLWKGHLLRGSLEMLTGLPDIGKSQVHCQYVACITTGRDWPDGTANTGRGNVIMLTAEDNTAQILVPRLMAAGADLERVLILQRIRKDNKNRMFLLSEDLEELERAIVDFGEVWLTTFDPITAYMGGGKRFDYVAFSAITHPAKNAGPRALDHYLGSQAFIAAARLGHLCVDEIGEDVSGQRQASGRALFTSPKHNVAQRRIPAIAYRIEEAAVLPGITAPHIVWEETMDITADEALAAASPAKDKNRGAVAFLGDVLASAPVHSKIILRRGEVHGFSEDQLRRAKDKMGVVAYKDGMVGGWMWALPQHAPKN